MKRDMDMVRDVLLAIEAGNSMNLISLTQSMSISSNEDLQSLVYHLDMLIDQTGFVSGTKAHTMGGKNWLDLNLTWPGHEFLDDIRDPEIWKQTKAGAEKVGGFSIDLVGALAKGFLKKKIEQHTGIDLDL